VPLSEEADNDAATREGDGEGCNADQGEDLQGHVEFILPAVDKVSAFLPLLTLSVLTHSPPASKNRPCSSFKSTAEGTLAGAGVR
jgi:hypothetical protein